MTRVLLVGGVAAAVVVAGVWLLGLALMDLGADFDPDPWGDDDD